MVSEYPDNFPAPPAARCSFLVPAGEFQPCAGLRSHCGGVRWGNGLSRLTQSNLVAAPAPPS